MHYRCAACGKETPVTTHAPTCTCGGLFDLVVDAPKWDEKLIDRSAWSLFRYRAFLGVDTPEAPDAPWRRITMGEGMTPVIPFDENLLFKMDYFMPTLSFKDRGAATLVAHMAAIGVKKCVQDSSGNAGNSVAAYCARAGIECEIYVPEGTSPKKITMIEAHGAKAVVAPGTRDHCADVCRARVKEEGVFYANHVFNPFFYEGTKTYVYEAFEQLGRMPKHVLVPVGNGTLFIGTVLALEHLQASGAIDEFPQIIAVQGENCAPLWEAVQKGSPEPAQIEVKPTLAEGIAIGQPMRGRELLDMIRRHDIRVVTAREDEILGCRHEIARRGIYCEHTTAANLAAYRRYCELYGPTPDTVITMCGAGIKSDH